MRDVSIVGIGSTRFGRHAADILPLAVEAAEQAIADSGVGRKEIGALYFGNFLSGRLSGQEILAARLGDTLQLANIPCTKVEGACASGSIAFRHAWLAVASGLCDAALAVGAEKMTHVDVPEVVSALNCSMDIADGHTGLTPPGVYGLAWRVHAGRHGTTREQVSSVVIKNKANGLKNPLAQLGAEISNDEIERSPMIAAPLRRLDCCPVSDGAAAIVVTAKDRSKGRPDAVDVLAAIQTRGSPSVGGYQDLSSFDATVEAARRAYSAAGISAQDIDFAELHDCFSIAEILDSEDLQLVPRGRGHIWAQDGRTRVGGDVAINPSGGLLAKGHPVGATGVAQIHEAVLQMRGSHPNQVKNATFGLTHNLGGAGAICSVNIIARRDR
ncbi:MAG TPA: beta-ketoacyl synthase N-terminal-like domain-containing protein [Rhizobiaceae bacterium]|nr:beta-ketoacyl synthase N-terminal-like domain-containing protein [Rhizobiaceae bacterium]